MLTGSEQKRGAEGAEGERRVEGREVLMTKYVWGVLCLLGQKSFFFNGGERVERSERQSE